MNDENIKLTELVFINLASGYFYNYESTLDENDRNKCLLYINESLKKVANYGEAYALKLELLMIDYRYNTDPVKKENIKSEAKKVMMQMIQSNFRLELVTISWVMISNPSCTSMSSTIVMAPNKKNNMPEISPNCPISR